jgi:hypothetical protein
MEPIVNEIQRAVGKIFVKGNYFYSDYITSQLGNKKTMAILMAIIEKSGKTPTEAIMVFLAAIRYIKKDLDAFAHFEKGDLMGTFIDEHYDELIHLSATKKVQGNIPERGFPLLEVLGKNLPDEKIGVIELGASYGLIGSCLLEPDHILGHPAVYRLNGRQMPVNPKKIDAYLGIDIDPPDKEWLLSCFSVPEDARMLQKYLDTLEFKDNHRVIKASALDFSKLKEVKGFTQKDIKPVVLTSFMLYQFGVQQKKQLIDEIMDFVAQHNGHWISQEVAFKDNGDGLEYYIAWDGKKIIEMPNDKCDQWSWC